MTSECALCTVSQSAELTELRVFVVATLRLDWRDRNGAGGGDNCWTLAQRTFYVACKDS